MIKELSAAGVDWRSLHVIDAFSLVYSLRIDDMRKYARRRAQERMEKAGVRNITPATEDEFAAL